LQHSELHRFWCEDARRIKALRTPGDASKSTFPHGTDNGML
jgi:hypothetical protein